MKKRSIGIVWVGLGLALIAGLVLLRSARSSRDDAVESLAPRSPKPADLVESGEALDETARPDERSEERDGGGRVRVSSAEDGASLAAAVTWIGTDLARGSATAVHGVVELPGDGRYALAIEAEGYVPVEGICEVRGELVVALKRSGTVRLQFSGAPPGVALAAALIADSGLDEEENGVKALERVRLRRAPLRLAFEPERELSATVLFSGAWDGLEERHVLEATSDDGVIVFSGVPPAVPARWMLATRRPVVMDPPHESPRIEFRADGTVVDNDTWPPEGLSGLFQVQKAATVTFHPQLPKSLSIVGLAGATAEPLPCGRADMRLTCNLTFENPAGAPNITSREVFASTTAGADGAFQFDGIAPQDLVVRARWRCPPVGEGQPERFFVANRPVPAAELENAAGGILDVGRLAPLATSHTFSFEFRSPDGAVYSPEEVLADLDAQVNVAINGGRDLTWENDSLQQVDMPLAGSLEMIGLYPAAYYVRVLRGGGGIEAALRPGYLVLDAPYAGRKETLEIDTRTSSATKIEIIVGSAVTVLALARAPELAESNTPPLAYFHELSRNKVHVMALFQRSGDVWVGSGVLPETLYDVLVLHGDGPASSAQLAREVGVFRSSGPLLLQSLLAFDSDLAGWDPLRGGEGFALGVDLEPRVELRGRAVDAQGAGIAGRVLELTPWRDEHSSQPYPCTTDDTGAFSVWVYPGEPIYVAGSEQPIVPDVSGVFVTVAFPE